jgi:putative DNA methylase
LLDQASSGPFYLRQPAIADMIVEAIQYNANTLGHYALHAFAVMPNHVHVLVTPAVSLPKLAKSLKGITAKRANAMLALTGRPFWQEESYDRLVRNAQEFERIRNYIEENPVRAGLVKDAVEYRWSSAGRAASPPQRQ